MIFEVRAGPGGVVLWADGRPWAGTLTQHDLNDLEFALAINKAMTSRCPARAADRETVHACALAPRQHGTTHICRACTHTWLGCPVAGDCGTVRVEHSRHRRPPDARRRGTAWVRNQTAR